MPKKTIFITGIIMVLGLAPSAWAQELSTGIAKVVEINDSQPFNGAVVCAKTTGFALCDMAYATTMFGVVVNNPAAVFNSEATTNGQPVLSDGVTDVRVSDKNGKIGKGDMVTTSETPGMGMKATENGYVLGTALADARQLPTGELMVFLALNIHPEAQLAGTRSNLVSVLRESVKAPILEPLAAFRYVLAALLIVIAFTLGFVYFGKMANTGVEAIGRNPLAEKLIRRNIILHVMVTMVIIAVGLGAAYLVLIL